MKKYTLIIWLLLVVCLEASAALQVYEKTSLLRSLTQSKQGSVERLEVLYKLVQATKAEPPVRTYYVNQLLKEAEAQQNNEYKCHAYLIHMFIAYNMYDAKAVNYWMTFLEPLARKEKLYDLLFQGRRCIIDFYQISEEYEREEKEANEMLEEATKLKNDIGIINAYQCLSNAYSITSRITEAIDVLIKAYPIALKVEDPYLVLEISGTLIERFQQMNDEKNRLKYIKIQETYIAETLEKHPELKKEFSSSVLDMYIAFISYYTDTNDYAQAEKYRLLAEGLNTSNYGSYTYATRYYIACYDLYNATENYEKALETIGILLELFKDISPYTHNTINYSKANLLMQLKRYDEALTLYKSINAEKDSIQLSILNKQVEQVRKSYDADNLLLEKQRINLYINLISILIVVIVFLVILGLVIRSYRVQSYLRKSEQEMRNMAQEMELMNQAKERFLSSISANISQPLNGVVEGSLRLISEDNLPDDERKKISEEITLTSDDLMKLINNILDLSRLEAGMMKYGLNDLELVNFTKSFVASLEANNGMQVRVVLPQREVMLNTDVTRLSELMTRLLSKADKENTEVAFEVHLSADGNSVECRATGSALASTQPSQDTIIMNEINRLFVEHFKGNYHIEKGIAITFSFPVSNPQAQ